MFGYPKWRAWIVIVVSILGVFFSIPNFMSPETYKTKVPENMQSWWRPMTLGLDLQGGSSLLLEVKVADLVNERLNSLADGISSKMREEGIKRTQPKVENGVLSMTVLNADDVSKAKTLISGLSAEKLNIQTQDKEIKLSYTDEALMKMKASAVSQAIEIVRRRIDALATKEPSIQQQGSDRISVQLPGVQDPNEVVKMLGKTAKLTFHLEDTENSIKDIQRGKGIGSMVLSGADTLVVKKAPVVGGDQLESAKPGYDQNGDVIINFSFYTQGARAFAKATRENIDKKLAIVLDGQIISAPVIRDEIKGQGSISGNFTMQEAIELSAMLRSGALPAPLEVVETKTVGAGLGEDSIQKGAWSCVIGAILVFAFMLFVYGWFGMFANIALVINVCLIFAILSALGATLTLPGLAGIALTIGMAVDSNVLIYARMRDEIKAGHTVVLNVIDAGFEHSFTAIFDSQITTLFAAIVLFFMGSGPVKGFSITLGIGIFTSLFTALLVTKFLIMIWYSVFKPKSIKLKV